MSGLSLTISGPLDEVLEFLNRRGEEDFSITTGSDPRLGSGGAVRVQGQDLPWTQAEITALKSQQMNPMARAMMDICSTQPETWIANSTIYQTAGIEKFSARAYQAGFTRHIRSSFPSHSEWPISAKWGPHLLLGDEMYYQVSEEIARWWNQA